MKYSIKYLAALLSVMFVFTSCIKNDVEPLGEKGTPMISIGESPDQVLYFSPFSGKKDIDLFTLIRDEVSNSAVNQSFSITIAINEALLDEYNDENETDFELLPENIGQVVSGKGVESKGNGEYTVTFGPGITNVPFTVRIDGDAWDLSKTYGVYFTIKDTNGKIIKSGKEGIMAGIAIKNAYDGVYEITGSCVDANGLYEGDYGDPEYPRTYELATTGPNTGLSYDLSWDYPNYLVINISTGAAANTGIRPQLTFDPDTNEIIDFINFNNTDQEITSFSGNYDPDSKTITLNWVIGRWTVEETWKYIRSR